MSNLFGLILQSQQKLTKVSNLNLLIVNDEGAEVEAIIKALQTADVDFTYCSTSVSDLSVDLSDSAYDAILYNYCLLDRYQTPQYPLIKLHWWQKIKKAIPLILITDLLGDEIAIECIQAGISGYVLRHKLYKLPIILEQSLSIFAQKQAQEVQLT